jgi:hypothetical protein
VSRGPGSLTRARNDIEEPFDVAEFVRAMRDSFHEEQVFQLRQPDTYVAEIVECGSRYCGGLEWQSAEDDVDIDSRVGMTKEQYARAIGELDRILDAGKEVVGLCRPDRLGPLVMRDHGERI